MKHIKTFESFLNESLNEAAGYWSKKVDFKDWLKEMLKVRPFLLDVFKNIKVDPKKLTEDNFFDIISKKGEVYNDDWRGMVLYKAGGYLSVAKHKEKDIIYFGVIRELSQYGDWEKRDGIASGTITKSADPKIDTSREGT